AGITDPCVSSANSTNLVSMFLSFGSLEPKDAIEDLRYFDNQLKSHYKNIETKFVEFADETHGSVMPAMLSSCMWYLYKKN
ncbi:MAG: hypothetical protein ACKOUQ_08530, partial [Aquirufa sp.]